MQTMIVRLAISLVAMSLASTAVAQVYKWVDKDGKVHYTDSPPPLDAKKSEQKRFVPSVIDTDKLPASVATAVKNNPVVLYTSDCGPICASARAYLDRRGIPATTRNPTTDPAAAEQLQKLAGGLNVPTLTIGSEVLKGYEENTWAAALDTAGYPRTNPGLRPDALGKEPAKEGKAPPPKPGNPAP